MKVLLALCVLTVAFVLFFFFRNCTYTFLEKHFQNNCDEIFSNYLTWQMIYLRNYTYKSINNKILGVFLPPIKISMNFFENFRYKLLKLDIYNSKFSFDFCFSYRLTQVYMKASNYFIFQVTFWNLCTAPFSLVDQVDDWSFQQLQFLKKA